ncbi:hypothetical protein C2845_PM01G21280 [Panicum miliaceum]|uniref:Uncharacterized protein n=1 Tax=Panicum miliaceum TaxID=4540 RepID=A0A3L6TEM9_PANMI|nr:hypothetical protein C2845_PM01G21280 [Panicum miliaceum]
MGGGGGGGGGPRRHGLRRRAGLRAAMPFASAAALGGGGMGRRRIHATWSCCRRRAPPPSSGHVKSLADSVVAGLYEELQSQIKEGVGALLALACQMLTTQIRSPPRMILPRPDNENPSDAEVPEDEDE